MDMRLRTGALMELAGVDPCVAEAVRCFAFGLSAVLMDTNTVRVAARYFGFSSTPQSRCSIPLIWAVAHLVNPQEPCSSRYPLTDDMSL